MKTHALKINMTQKGRDDLERLIHESGCKTPVELFTKSISLFEVVLEFQNRGYKILVHSPDGSTDELQPIIAMGS